MTTEAPEITPHAPTRSHDTEPVDYAALNAVWGALVTALVVAVRNRRLEDDPFEGPEMLYLAAATFALSKVIAREKIGTWVREPFVDEQDPQHRPRGRRIRRAVGELVTCTRCVGAWSSLGLVGLRVANPPAGRIVTSVLAASAANDWLQAGFRVLTGWSNRVNP